MALKEVAERVRESSANADSFRRRRPGDRRRRYVQISTPGALEELLREGQCSSCKSLRLRVPKEKSQGTLKVTVARNMLAFHQGFAVVCGSDPASSHFYGEGFRWVLVGRIGFTGE